MTYTARSMPWARREDIVEYVALDADPADEGISDLQLDSAYRCTASGNSCLMTYDSTPAGAGQCRVQVLPGRCWLRALPTSKTARSTPMSANGWSVMATHWMCSVLAGFDAEFGASATAELRQELCDLHDEYCDDGES